jgi:hypothetical protein
MAVFSVLRNYNSRLVVCVVVLDGGGGGVRHRKAFDS